MIKWSTVLAFCLILLAANGFAGNVLVNSGFETGTLPPWFNSFDFCGGCTWAVTSTDAHTGLYSAFVIGNRALEQDFLPIADASITEASLWLKMPDTGVAAVFFLYSDTSYAQNIVTVGNTWTFFDMTSFLDPTKSLVSFGVYGCNGCAGLSQTFADDFEVSTTPEPGTMVLLGTGLMSAAGIVRRRFVEL
jgi:PEP-CTERM motif